MKSSLLQLLKQKPLALHFQLFPDKFFFRFCYVHALDWIFDNSIDEILGLLLLLDSCILDGAFSGYVAKIHLVWLIFIGFHIVCDHVDDNFSILVVLGQCDVLFCASKRLEIVGCDFLNFFQELSFALLCHFSLFDGEVELILILLFREAFNHTFFVFIGIFHFKCRCFLWNFGFVSFNGATLSWFLWTLGMFFYGSVTWILLCLIWRLVRVGFLFARAKHGYPEHE